MGRDGGSALGERQGHGHPDRNVSTPRPCGGSGRLGYAMQRTMLAGFALATIASSLAGEHRAAADPQTVAEIAIGSQMFYRPHEPNKDDDNRLFVGVAFTVAIARQWQYLKLGLQVQGAHHLATEERPDTLPGSWQTGLDGLNYFVTPYVGVVMPAGPLLIEPHVGLGLIITSTHQDYEDAPFLAIGGKAGLAVSYPASSTLVLGGVADFDYGSYVVNGESYGAGGMVLFRIGTRL
jgi:hypothetical protein